MPQNIVEEVKRVGTPGAVDLQKRATEIKTQLKTLTLASFGLGCLELSLSNNAIIDEALALGVRSFYTSDCYGQDHESERALGEKIKNLPRESIFVSTMGGLCFTPSGVKVSGSAAYLTAACEASLKRLQTPYLDVYYLHRVDPNTPIEDSMAALAALKKAGKIKGIGLSEITADQLRRALSIEDIVEVQLECAPWETPDKKVLELCEESGTRVVAYSPLGRAFFTKNDARYFQTLNARDYRNLLPRYLGDNLLKNLELRKDVEKLAVAKGCSLPQLALAWAMHKGFSVIPATTNKEHLLENAAAVLLALSPEELGALDEAFKKCQFAGERYPSSAVSAIYPESTARMPRWQRNIILGLSFATAIGGLFAYSRYARGNTGASSLLPASTLGKTSP